MLQILYTIIISPIEFIIEFVFVFFYKVFHNLGIPIVGVSLVVSLLSLPLYMMAEHWQVVERETVSRFRKKINKIKSVFKKDEQFMVLSVFYRQNHYHPIYALRSSLGLFVQIPFFIAAYSYLSNLEILHNVSFFFIRDLGKPDSLIYIKSFPVNILPILMTLINCIAGAVYVKGLSIRDKIQIYAMALLFLVILYNSPSALVIYWTLNNIFSLLKNIFYRLKKPAFVLYLIGCIISIMAIIHLLFFMPTRVFSKRLLVACIISIFFFLPLIAKAVNSIKNKLTGSFIKNEKQLFIVLFTACLTLTFLCGYYIPSSIISTSPAEFCYIGDFTSPFPFLLHSFLFYLGIFTIWPVCIAFLFPVNVKSFLIPIISFISILAVVYTFIFSGSYGIISNTFQFMTTGVLKTGFLTGIFSIISLILLFFILFIIIRSNKFFILDSIFSILLIPIITISIINSVKINKTYTELKNRSSTTASIKKLASVFTLSQTDKNIIVLMADTAINGFTKLIFNDLPQLQDQFDGFTLYTNTASFSNHTLMAVPVIWGGYEYSPAEINRRKDIPLVAKHNEALLTLPVLLKDSGFNVTVTDPSWANYAWIPDNSIYTPHNITAFNTERNYTDLWLSENDPEYSDFTSRKIKRNIIWFSFLKINNPMLRSIIYDSGWYWNTDNMGASILDFIHSYSVLDYLTQLTKFESSKGEALLITNDIAHKYGYLEPSTLKPTSLPVSLGSTIYSNNDYYHTNAALYLKLGDWFDYLKANNAYDNTRIIIVADHGAGIEGLIPREPLSIPGENREKYNPLLLIKDFNQKGPLLIDDSFMTNADVPVLALQGINNNPVNPFTGNPINMNPKNNGIFISTCHIPMADGHGKYTFNIKNDEWIHLKNSIFESTNWTRTVINQ